MAMADLMGKEPAAPKGVVTRHNHPQMWMELVTWFSEAMVHPNSYIASKVKTMGPRLDEQ
jgi:hypothetical protein